MVVVTHYQRLLNYIVPDFVHVLVDGRIMRSGGPELAFELEANRLRRVRGRGAADDARIRLRQEQNVRRDHSTRKLPGDLHGVCEEHGA